MSNIAQAIEPMPAMPNPGITNASNSPNNLSSG